MKLRILPLIFCLPLLVGCSEESTQTNNGGEQDETPPVAPEVEYNLCNLSNTEYQARVDEMESRQEMLPYIYGKWVMESRLDWANMLADTGGHGFYFREMDWMSPFRKDVANWENPDSPLFDTILLGNDERGTIEFRTEHTATVDMVISPSAHPFSRDVLPNFFDSNRPIGEVVGEFRFEFMKFRRDNRHHNMLVMNEIGKQFPTTEDGFQRWTTSDKETGDPLYDVIHFAYTISNDDDPTKRQVLSLTLAHTEDTWDNSYDTQVYVFRLQCE